ncbi:hypothetical protein AAH235_002153 [Providencia stuartii]|uniref:hypothetical protein n=1 Tax=Providencia TaxID=586 RepID=UPI000D836C6A|nr:MULTISPECIES: hypothetical protein [Providencia]RMA15434.1 hypothetical protein EA147_05855 [Providencia stuartii]SPY70982.1 Uncharacterised protein [Providencia stuartii]HEM6870902.1 hypothetical protein [Providencia stuartii]HEM7174686.1 hypothetical protein [Providencia stuartii]HEM7517150.1 hypothetical protein [Providencia stuartii]
MATPEKLRKLSPYTSEQARQALDSLLLDGITPNDYQKSMSLLGAILGDIVAQQIPTSAKCLVVSTAEDADYLSHGVWNRLKTDHDTKAAVFWNNHYSLGHGVSVAPIVHKYLEPGYEEANRLIIVKSVISGSCVVRTNILEVIEKVCVNEIFIVSPVMHINSEKSLKNEFPADISCKFKFIYFAIDSKKDNVTGEVIPGIGGEIYQKLGLISQPAKISFMPNLVKQLADI